MSKPTGHQTNRRSKGKAPQLSSSDTSSRHAEAPQKGNSSLVSPRLQPGVTEDTISLPHPSPSGSSGATQEDMRNLLRAQTFSQRETTPDQPQQKVTAYGHLSTPHSHYSSSYTAAVPPGDKKYLVSETNRYLQGDLRLVRILPVEKFAEIALKLDIEEEYIMSKEVKRAFDKYQRVVDQARSEKDPRVYIALIELLNAISHNKLTFYGQAFGMVQGSLVNQSPDIAGVLKELADLGDDSDEDIKKKVMEDLKKKVMWAHLMMIVESKITKGRLIKPEFGQDKDAQIDPEPEVDDVEEPLSNSDSDATSERESQQRQGSQKRPREEEPTLGVVRGRALKASRTSSTSQPHSGNSSTDPSGLEHTYATQAGPDRLAELPVKRDTPEGVRSQVMGYARDMLSYGLPRSHVVNFLVDSQFARCIYYDRSLILESKLLNLKYKKDRLIFAKMVKHIGDMSLEDLGFSPSLEANFIRDPASLMKLEKPAAEEFPSSRILTSLEGSFFTFPYQNNQTRTVCLKRVIFRSNGVIGRGTMVIRVTCACRHCPRDACDWQAKKLVLKLSFPSATRVSELIFMDRCKQLAQGEHAWVLNHLPDITWSFDISFPTDSPQDALSNEFGATYEKRVMRGVIQEELKPLSYLQTAKQCAQVFYDVFQCHHWVWKYPEILHRDISQGNIMVREKNGTIYGVLNDWDLATWLDNKRDGPTSLFRTGTKPYMAHEQQTIHWRGPHRYRHDMESLFYVMVLFACLYSSPKEKVPNFEDKDFRFEEWHRKDDEFLRHAKNTVVTAASFMPPVSPFFIGFLFWLTELQERLALGFVHLMIHIKQAAKQKARQPNTLPTFDMETLGDHFSCEQIAMILHMFDNEQLTTRGLEWQNILEGLSQ
ncbi:hypothetical protein F5890DRAFT_1587080 [Lentinula detonsa]|uniref:Protein kinase domain-containing protein n=1 Tax=Lentinula detonsa TaxID=2804962 RepID=A0AA38UQS3_9AGAR|nr:hypothetical protein F5890DRAFT_1587080 [Lentinula detonsa]